MVRAHLHFMWFAIYVRNNDLCILCCVCFVAAVDGREGKEGVEKLVDCGKAAVGFVLSAVPTAQIMRVADAGQLLPAKVHTLFVCVCNFSPHTLTMCAACQDSVASWHVVDVTSVPSILFYTFFCLSTL